MRFAETIPRVYASLTRRVPSPPIPPDRRAILGPRPFERSSPSQSYRARAGAGLGEVLKTQQLAEGARDFCDTVSQLNDIVKTVVETVDQHRVRVLALPSHVILSR